MTRMMSVESVHARAMDFLDGKIPWMGAFPGYAACLRAVKEAAPEVHAAYVEFPGILTEDMWENGPTPEFINKHLLGLRARHPSNMGEELCKRYARSIQANFRDAYYAWIDSFEEDKDATG